MRMKSERESGHGHLTEAPEATPQLSERATGSERREKRDTLGKKEEKKGGTSIWSM